MREMMQDHDHLAGRSRERLTGLSDAVFAVAMTLLVLDLRLPAKEDIHSDLDLWREVIAISPQLITYFLSFLTLGIFWHMQHVQLLNIERCDRDFTWIHIAFLSCVSLLPLSTGLLREFIRYRPAVVCFWLNVLLAGLLLRFSWRHAERLNLIKEGTDPEVGKVILYRLNVSQILYAFGAALSIINTHLSIGFIMLTQLVFAVAPRMFGRRWR